MTAAIPAIEAVQSAAIDAAGSITALPVKAVTTTDWPHWRIAAIDELESGRNKDGSGTAPVVYASIFSRDLSQVYNELASMGTSLPTAIDPTGFRVLGLKSRTRRLGDSEDANGTVYGGQVEIELIVEPEAA